MMDIPNLGKFFIRNHTAAIAFDDHLISDTLVNKIQLCMLIF